MTFKTVAELIETVSKLGDVNKTASSTVSVSTSSKEIEEDTTDELSPAEKAANKVKKAKKAKKAKKEAEEKAAKIAVEEASKPTTAPTDTAASVMTASQPVAPVQAIPEPIANVPVAIPAAPVAQAPASNIDKAGLIAKATAAVNEMKQLGVADAQVMPTIQAIFDKFGAPKVRISELSDEFLPHVVQDLCFYVESLRSNGAASTTQYV